MSTEKALELINSTFDGVKKFIARTEINIVDILMDSDEDDGYLDRNELKRAFERLGVTDITNEQIDAFFVLLDPRKTGKLD